MSGVEEFYPVALAEKNLTLRNIRSKKFDAWMNRLFVYQKITLSLEYEKD